MNGAAEVGGADVGGGAGAAIEVHMADGRGRNVSPGVVAGVVRVVEGHAVPGHGVVVVDEAAEEDLGLAVADAVGGVADGAGSGLDDVGEVGYRRGVLSDIVAGDSVRAEPASSRDLTGASSAAIEVSASASTMTSSETEAIEKRPEGSQSASSKG